MIRRGLIRVIRASCSVLLLMLLAACHSEKHYERLVGEWTIVEIESRAERLELDEILESKDATFTGYGHYQLGELPTCVRGNWKIKDGRLQLIQPEVKDLSGRIISRQVQQEWELTLAEKWMIWRGTALNNTQHLKIMLRKKQLDDD